MIYVPLADKPRIISTVLGWDITELKKRSLAIEEDKNVPSKEQLDILKAHCEQTDKIHQQYRAESGQEANSRVTDRLLISTARRKPIEINSHNHPIQIIHVYQSV